MVNVFSFWQSHAIIFFLAMALVTAYGMLALRTLQFIIRAYAAQSLFLGVATFLMALSSGHRHILIIAALTILIKGWIIPWFLLKIMQSVKIRREASPSVSYPLSMLGGMGLGLLAYLAMKPLAVDNPLMGRSYILSLTLILLGLWLMVSRRKAITQAVGLLVVDNGLYVAALSTSFAMPMIVELGLAFDLLVVVIVMGLLIFRIQNTYDSINTEYLSRLKG